MATIAGTRPNYYELLGLTPTATDEEIRQAFAREISPFRPRAIGGLADISIAYETLRDTARRRSYDASIGIEPDRAPPAPRAEGWHKLGSVHVGPIGQPVVAVVPRPEPEAVAAAAPEPLPEPEPQPRPEPEAVAAAAPEPLPQPQPRPDPIVRAEAPRRVLEELGFPKVEERPVEWRRPALMLGGLFAGVALVGAGLGLYASRDVEPAQAEAAARPVAPKPIAPAVEPPTVIEPAVNEAQSMVPRQPKPAATRIRRTVPAQPVMAESQVADEIPDLPTEQVVAQTAPAPDSAATMPMSNAAIARVIGRIGYACGSVTSTTAVEGSPGVFSVTCSSGDSYRAAPVRGRYHFRRSH
jgi:hypothetical protein